jgi:hypothetical protein
MELVLGLNISHNLSLKTPCTGDWSLKFKVCYISKKGILTLECEHYRGARDMCITTDHFWYLVDVLKL